MIILNEHGKAIWTRYNGRLSLERTYSWCDHMVLIDEENQRRVITSFKFSTFDFEGWEPMTKEEYTLRCKGPRSDV